MRSKSCSKLKLKKARGLSLAFASANPTELNQRKGNERQHLEDAEKELEESVKANGQEPKQHEYLLNPAQSLLDPA